MKIGEEWFDIDGNKYEVTDIQEVEAEDGSVLRNIISKQIS